MATLETLPSVVLDLVCDFLRIDHFEDCRSLHSFALASRTCRLASERSRFRRLKVKIHDLSNVAQAVRDATAMLTGRMHHVRGLSVDYESHCADPRSHLGKRCDHSTLVGISKQQRRNINLDALADLICHLPGLTHLTWAMPIPAPPALLRPSTPQGPNYRLEIWELGLQSLYTPVGQKAREMDAADYTILTSPRLDTFSCWDISAFDDDGNWSYHEEAILQALASPQCQLEHVSVDYSEPEASFSTQDVQNHRRPSRPGLFSSSLSQRPHNDQSTSTSKRALTSLSINFRPAITSYLVDRWKEVIDFSTLISLNLGVVKPELLPMLGDMAATGALRSLQVLELTPDLLEYDNVERTINDLCSLLKVLCPLRGLHLGRTRSHAVFDTLLETHGPHLRELSLDEPVVFTSKNAYRLAEVCRRVRDLNITIRRTGGDEAEVAFYHALGHLSRLESVSIIFDCTRPEATGLINHGVFSSDKYNREARIGLVQDALVNVAIDEELARSMFLTIAQTQKRRANQTGSRQFLLRRLTVECLDSDLFGRGDYSHSELSILLEWLRGHWICESSIGLRDPDAILDDKPGGQAHKAVLARDESLQRKMEYEEDLYEHLNGVDPLVEDAWLRLWLYGRGDWKQSWKSQPLASSARHMPV
ncbi:uncharacterized protein F5Z01DRAFT_495796 [Emericellopsis atlantica]|uniref:Uncharacterized protein n=1 Tax=Emericellopsis atlantica TaxID=2614577 RepID=A0A9P7ZDC6_9HYPO|nr:uncharacterized protein F5Z01DRAFT_495796 [Emericellopsis atlantica]KAG9249485.1 hypothetical protein F5Z01DRAFT_495796 [Emericellopsis atlantica]